MLKKMLFGVSNVTFSLSGLYEVPMLHVPSKDKKISVADESEKVKNAGVEKPAGKK